MNFNLGDAVDGQGGQWPGGQPSGQPQWPGGGGNNNPVWNPSGPQPSGGWSNPPSQPSGPGGWANPSPQPSGPGGWPNPSPQPSAPGGWPSPSPGPGPGPGGWANPSPQPSAPGGWPSPSPGPGPGPTSPHQSLAVPCNRNLPRGVYDKLLITIAGTVKPHADKFTLDFYTSAGDLAFHFNPRFNEQGKKVIVRNSCISKKWGKEERDLSYFPFVQGQPFELKVTCTNAAFMVDVNGRHLLEYRHRITNLRDITRFNIYNDITLSNVKIG